MNDITLFFLQYSPIISIICGLYIRKKNFGKKKKKKKIQLLCVSLFVEDSLIVPKLKLPWSVAEQVAVDPRGDGPLYRGGDGLGGLLHGAHQWSNALKAFKYP